MTGGHPPPPLTFSAPFPCPKIAPKQNEVFVKTDDRATQWIQLVPGCSWKEAAARKHFQAARSERKFISSCSLEMRRMRHVSQDAPGKTTARPRPRLEEFDENQIASWKMSAPSGNCKELLGIPGAAFAVFRCSQ